MKKETLKDWFKFQVWRQSGGTLPELCDLSEIREWLNETADDPDLDARISAVQTAIGDYNSKATESTITEDLAKLQAEVETGETGLLDRATALQDQIGDYDPGATESTITDDLEELQTQVQTAIDGAPDAPVAATLTTGAGNSGLLWTAKTAGKMDEAISVKFEIPATELTITPAVGGTASAIKYTGVKGQEPISVTYVMTGPNTFAIERVPNTNAIIIALDSSEGICETTAGELFTALEAAVATGGELEGIISAVEKAVPDEWADATLMEPNAEDFLDSALSVSTDGNAITVSLAYDGAKDSIASTANDIITAIEADEPGANDLVTVAATGAGTAFVDVKEETNLDNGADGTPGAKGALRFDASGLYVSTDASTTAVSNWKSITFDTEEG